MKYEVFDTFGLMKWMCMVTGIYMVDRTFETEFVEMYPSAEKIVN